MTFINDNKIKQYSIRIFFFFALISILAVMSGCGSDKEKKNNHTAVEQQYSEGNVSLELSIDKQELNLADTVTVKLRARAPENWQIKFPEFKNKVADFELADIPETDNKVDDNGKDIVSTMTLVLKPFLAGEYQLVPLEVQFINLTDKKNITLDTDECFFNVKSVIIAGDDGELKDISGVLALQTDYLYLYLLCGAGGLGLVVVAVLLIRKYMRYKAALRAIRYPHELAFERLDRLEKKSLLEKGLFAEFYTEVTDILRHYINMRFAVKAEESTTEEFLRFLSTDIVVLGKYRDSLKKFLEHCDLVKFAKVKPSKDECGGVMQSCRDFIEQTKRENID